MSKRTHKPMPKWAVDLATEYALVVSEGTRGRDEAARNEMLARDFMETRRKALEEAALACEAIEAAVEDLPEPDGPATHQLCRDLEAQTAAQCASDIRALGGLRSPRRRPLNPRGKPKP